ncbi:MAG TPA: DoxX family protein [Candidatus Angelobacter sp.]|nr:DoxX family protein [Candidatus Angelobacter sp.]
MAAETTAVAPSNKLRWTGRIISGLIVLFLLSTSIYGITNAAKLAPQAAKYGYPEGAMLKIQITCIICALLYAFPRTAILGAILLTGYLGGATSTHVRASEPFFFPILVAVLAWGAIFLRDERLRALLPLRR